jgi:tetratricopeptide (TPR) repeat protein
MHRTARINLTFTGIPSCEALADLTRSVGISTVLRQSLSPLLDLSASSIQILRYVEHALILGAEHAYTLRNIPALEQISQRLLGLPLGSAREIGLFYKAMVLKRTGRLDMSQSIFEDLSTRCSGKYRDRAIQALAAIQISRGDLFEALRFQGELLRCLYLQQRVDPDTLLTAQLNTSAIRSIDGDHVGALQILENLGPLARHLWQQRSLVAYGYHNELALELASVGRIEEAKASLAVALNSPFSYAYPEWWETHAELDTVTTSEALPRVAHSAPPSVASLVAPDRLKHQRRVDSQHHRRVSLRRLPVVRAERKSFVEAPIIRESIEALNLYVGASVLNRSIIHRLGKSIRPRAPPRA